MGKLIITVFIEKGKITKKMEMQKNDLIADVLKRLEINPVTVIVCRNDEIVLESEQLHDKDKLRILSVISGG